MTATVVETSPAMDAVGAEIASEIFDLLVRKQRGDPIATAVDHINFIGDGLRDALDPYLMHR
jgi:hypothetical protein